MGNAVGVVAQSAYFSGDGYSWGGGITVSFQNVPGKQAGLCIQLGECSHDWGKFVGFAHKIAAAELMYEALKDFLEATDVDAAPLRVREQAREAIARADGQQ